MSGLSKLVAFGPFTFDRAARSLCRSGVPVRLGGRALDVLSALLERPGEILSSQEIVAKVWPRTVVEETGLRVHISSLRRALGDGDHGARYIANVPGRGYTFVGTITDATYLTEQGPSTTSARQMHNLPPMLVRPLGRDETITSLRVVMADRRLVSVVGAGGMGKTTVAIATAEASFDLFPGGVRFVDLSPVSDPARVAPTIAAVFGISQSTETGFRRILDALRGKKTLIVLDNCEQVIDAAADAAQALISGSAEVHVLATSRESLNVSGEWIHRLAPLALPDADAPDDNTAASVQLFVQRARALDDGFALTPATAPLVHRLCRQLDGMPLALELAAARVDTLGLEDLIARLSDMFRVLTRGRRTAAPRHQTLQALLDWSHELLTDTDRVVFRRLSVFRGTFSLDTAEPIISCSTIGSAAGVESLLSLVSKSLVVVDHSVGALRYRLLATTRAYAMSKLRASGEWNAVARRHAESMRARMHLVSKEIEDLDQDAIQQSIASYTALLDDLRGALDWAASASGDARLGATVMVAAEKVIGQLGMMDEFRPRMEVALRQAQSLVPSDPVLELHALSALCRVAGVSPDYGTRNPGIFERLRALIDQTGDKDDRIAALMSLMTHGMGSGDYSGVAELAQQVIELSAGPHDPAAIFLGQRLLAQAHHSLGRHSEAREIVERILVHPTRKTHVQYVGNIPTSVSMRVLKARIAWICGAVDDALAITRECTDIARRMNPFVLGHALALGAIPVLLWRGEDDAARRLAIELRDLAHHHSLQYWASWAQMCEMAIKLRAGEIPSPPDARTLTVREADMASTWDQRLVTPQATLRAQTGAVGWSAAETLRAAAELGLREEAVDAKGAEDAWRRSMDLARSQGASSWELRIAMSQAGLRSRQGRVGDARELIERALGRFTQGAQTRDHVAAHQMLEDLARSRVASVD